MNSSIPVEEWSKLSSARHLFSLVGMDGSEFMDDEDSNDIDDYEDRFGPNSYEPNDLLVVETQAVDQVTGTTIKDRANDLLEIRK